MTTRFTLDPPLASADSGIHAKLEAQAARTARAMVKDRARDYVLQPDELDAIAEGLFELPPQHQVTALAYLARNRPNRARHFGFGGEIQAINLRAGMLYARYARAKAHQSARRAA